MKYYSLVYFKFMYLYLVSKVNGDNLIELDIISENSKISLKNKWTKTEYISLEENHVEQFLQTMETELTYLIYLIQIR